MEAFASPTQAGWMRPAFSPWLPGRAAALPRTTIRVHDLWTPEAGSWTPAHHTDGLREDHRSGQDALPHRADGLARRNPTLLFRFDAVLLLRLAERNLCGLLFHEPPRRTRRPSLADSHRQGATEWHR